MPKTILCIDDDPFYKDLYTAILEPKGFKVVTAMNPADGWKAIKESKPDLVTLDIMMPEAEGFFDGYGLLKKIRSDDEAKNTPVIMISALGDPEDVSHGLSAGATSYIPKQEMAPDMLLAEIKKRLGEK
jgi:DNA-binding response OmpR family regulator